MKLKKFVQNPVGRATANVSARYLVTEALYARAKELMRLSKISEPRVYRIDETLTIWIKIGSERYEDLWYDVILYTEEANHTDILDMDFSFWSNSPSFNFTYAYAFKQDGDLAPIAETLDLQAKKALEKPPVVRNPQELKGFEKSIFYAIFSLIENDDNRMANLEDHVIRNVTEEKHIILDFKANDMRSTRDKMHEYTKAKDKVKGNIALQRRQAKEERRKASKPIKKMRPISKIAKVVKRKKK